MNYIPIFKKREKNASMADRNRNEIVGNGAIKSGLKFYKKIEHHKIDVIATDGNYNYRRIIHKDIRHIINKSETCLVESKNSSLRDMLARLNRKTKRYSKSFMMLDLSIYLWRFKSLAFSLYS